MVQWSNTSSSQSLPSIKYTVEEEKEYESDEHENLDSDDDEEDRDEGALSHDEDFEEAITVCLFLP
jgi:hypothetical protein